MRYYRDYFHKEITRVVYFILFFSIVAVIFDQYFNSQSYPFWISWFNLVLVGTALLMIILSALTPFSIYHSFLIYTYLFTLNIYMPAFAGDEALRQTIISSFSNLGACMIYLFIAGIVGAGIQVLILGGINILAVFLIAYACKTPQQDILFDPINIIMFAMTSVLIYAMFRRIENAMIENEENKKRILAKEKEILSIRVEEERKRNQYLSISQSDNDLFVSKLINKITVISGERNEQERAAQMNEVVRFCIMQGYKVNQSEHAKWHKDTDTEFISRLKQKHPQLTPKEQYICSLLRINMNTKEIAEKLNKSEETIKWYRKRIRKKMQVQDDCNLAGFMGDL
ncbi:MAG: hypothetical protein JXB19_11670 [Bacteroidales bacterium]|nr:hypothetical protein [Bacteroidales bacterium]